MGPADGPPWTPRPRRAPTGRRTPRTSTARGAGKAGPGERGQGRREARPDGGGVEAGMDGCRRIPCGSEPNPAIRHQTGHEDALWIPPRRRVRGAGLRPGDGCQPDLPRGESHHRRHRSPRHHRRIVTPRRDRRRTRRRCRRRPGRQRPDLRWFRCRPPGGWCGPGPPVRGAGPDQPRRGRGVRPR
jgi:hypothetical protein